MAFYLYKCSKIAANFLEFCYTRDCPTVQYNPEKFAETRNPEFFPEGHHILLLSSEIKMLSEKKKKHQTAH